MVCGQSSSNSYDWLTSIAAHRFLSKGVCVCVCARAPASVFESLLSKYMCTKEFVSASDHHGLCALRCQYSSQRGQNVSGALSVLRLIIKKIFTHCTVSLHVSTFHVIQSVIATFIISSGRKRRRRKIETMKGMNSNPLSSALVEAFCTRGATQQAVVLAYLRTPHTP